VLLRALLTDNFDTQTPPQLTSYNLQLPLTRPIPLLAICGDGLIFQKFGESLIIERSYFKI